MGEVNEQQKLMQRIQRLEFAMLDAGMFLDTHPDCKQALTYFRKQQTALKTACTEYEDRFGPLTLKMQKKNDGWDWIDGPWPWEGKV